jgi:hypothetical protein
VILRIEDVRAAKDKASSVIYPVKFARCRPTGLYKGLLRCLTQSENNIMRYLNSLKTSI